MRTFIEMCNGLKIMRWSTGKYEAYDAQDRVMGGGSSDLDKTREWCRNYLDTHYIEFVDHSSPFYATSYYGPFSFHDAEARIEDAYGNELNARGDLAIVQLGPGQLITANIVSREIWDAQLFYICS